MQEDRRSGDRELALKTFVKLMRAAETVASRVHADLKKTGLTISQFAVLEALFHLGALCQKEIAGKILKTTGNITMVVDNLEKRGFVVRKTREQDRRSYMIELTESGRNLVTRVFPNHAKRIVQTMSRLDRQEMEELGKLLRKFRPDA